jgi:DNA end-binding protein Ku
MAARSSWRGFLQLSLVSIPVKAFTASSSSTSEISLNQLHAACHSRIRYQRTCPIHGEVSNDEIVMGYEYAKGQYVVIDTDELDKLRTEGDKAINVDSFVPIDKIDPLYLTGKTYYLTPDGPAGQKGYSLLRQALDDDQLCGVARVVLHSKEQLVLLRIAGKLISMMVLSYESQVKKPAAFEDEVVPAAFSPEELKLTKALVDATTQPKLDMERYKDEYTEKLTKLIELKVQGQEIVATPSEPQQVINLMDALKASVARASGKAPAAGAPPAPAAEAKPAKKMAESQRERKPSTRKKKSG